MSDPIERRIAIRQLALRVKRWRKELEDVLERLTGLRPANAEELAALAADVLQIGPAEVLDLSLEELAARLRAFESPPPPSAPPTDLTAARQAALLLYTGQAIGNVIDRIAAVLAGPGSVGEKLERMDALLPLPPTIGSTDLAVALGVSRQAVEKTAWWQWKRKGERAARKEERRRRLRERARGWTGD